MKKRIKVTSTQKNEEIITVVAEAVNSREKIVARIVCELNILDGSALVVKEESNLLDSLYDEIEDFVEFQIGEGLLSENPANLKLKFVK